MTSFKTLKTNSIALIRCGTRLLSATRENKKVLACGLAALALCMVPGESQAFWNWFRGGCCGAAAAPVVAAPVVTPAVASCNPCQQTVAYVPQTSYRVQYVNTPVTTYQPVPTCGACGTTTTAYMPTTTYQTQAQLVPYTSYRMAYAAAAPVVGASYYAPIGGAYSSSYVTSPATTSYSVTSYPNAAYAAPAYAAPAAVSYPAAAATTMVPSIPAAPAAPMMAPSPTPAPSQMAPAPPMPQPPTTQPSLPRTYAEPNGAPSATQPQTPSMPPSQPPTEDRLRPVPDPNTSDTTPANSGPALAPPSSRVTKDYSDDRWASIPAQPAVRTVAARPNSEATIRPAIDDGGWRPAR